MLTLTPPAIAISHSPARIAWTARCMAVSEDEHMVSTAMLGPVRSRAWDTRLAMDA